MGLVCGLYAKDDSRIAVPLHSLSLSLSSLTKGSSAALAPAPSSSSPMSPPPSASPTGAHMRRPELVDGLASSGPPAAGEADGGGALPCDVRDTGADGG